MHIKVFGNRADTAAFGPVLDTLGFQTEASPERTYDVVLAVPGDDDEIDESFVQSAAQAGNGGAVVVLCRTADDAEAALSAGADDVLLAPSGTLSAWLENPKALAVHLRRASRDSVAQALEATGEPVLVLDRAGVIRSASSAVRALLGHHPADVIGRAWQSFVHPDDLNDKGEGLRRRPLADDQFAQECRVRTADGHHLWIDASVRVSEARGSDAEATVIATLRDATARRHVDETLGLLQAAVEQSRDAVAIVTAVPRPGRIVYVNPAFTELTGYQPVDIVGASPTVLFGESTDRAAIAEADARLLEGKHSSHELINYRRDGSAFLCRTDVSPLFDDAGTLQFVVSTRRDVTAEREAQHLLTALAEGTAKATGADFMARLTELVTQRLGVDGAVVIAHHADGGEHRAELVAGTTKSERVLPLAFTVAPDSLCALLREHPMAEHPEGGARDPLLQHLGTNRALGIALRGSDRGPLGALVLAGATRRTFGKAAWSCLQIFADRAGAELERLSARRDLAAVHQRLEFALDGSGACLWDWNIAQDQTTFGRRWFALLARPAANGRCDDWRSMVHPDDQARLDEAMAAHVEGHEPQVESMFRIRHKKGGWVWIEARGRIVERSLAGAPRRLVGTHRDVTVQRDLEHRLLLADRMASVGTLAAGVAHEINNPLSFVLSNLDFLSEHLDTNSNADVREAMSDVLDGARRVRAIVQDLKVFARADDQDDMKSMDVADVVRRAERLVANEMRHRCQLELDLGEVPPVRGHAGKLGQVVVNLLVNAVQAFPERPSHENLLRVHLCATGSEVVLSVRDNGQGMSEAALSRVFDPFFTTKPVGVGTGLGLSICHTIITAMGGRIEMESQEDHGTTARIVLPIKNATTLPPPSRERPRLLLIDDERLIIRSLTRMLRADADVVAFQQPREALASLAADADFDGVLCDLMMPEMTGMAFCDALAAQNPHLAKRALFLTGGAYTPQAEAFLASQAGRILEKPFTYEALVDTLRNVGVHLGTPADTARASTAPEPAAAVSPLVPCAESTSAAQTPPRPEAAHG